MPETLGGLALFAALLVPGFVYLERRESRQAGQEHSPLRETGQILSASLVCDVLVVGLFAAVRTFAPSVTPDVGEFVREGHVFARLHYRELVMWGMAGLATAAALASLAAVPPPLVTRLIAYLQPDPESPPRQALARRQRPAIVSESGWSTAFFLYPERVPYLGVTLNDGTYFFGALLSCNPQLEESADRSVVLAGPIQMRPVGPEEAVHHLDGDTLVLSADQIKFVTVSYLPDFLGAALPKEGLEDPPGLGTE